MRNTSRLLMATTIATLAVGVRAETNSDEKSETELTVQQVVERVRPSLVAISVSGREGRQQAIGSGFVISEDGLIATNLHVIGDGREFSVERADGTTLQVLAIHATDRFHDLAIISVDTQDRQLPALPIGGAGQIQQGEAVVAMGSPLGLKHSVVDGIVSGIRDVDGQEMIQLAMPIEPGNSGGPVVDRQGRVHGVMNMKSMLGTNLGFAVDAAKLLRLMEKPNPITISRWTTTGSIDPDRWQPMFGARWRQRGGRILVSGQGTGFGGRSLCLAQRDSADVLVPFELAVNVKLDDESGAAGLVFHSDGGDKHYGFYPTGGKLRLTCFRGPTVFTWQILQDVETDHYRPGEWNHLKVRVEAEKFLCFVNDQLVIESTDQTLGNGQVGLAKFRHTIAEFREFQVADTIPPSQTSTAEIARLSKLIDKLPRLDALQPGQLTPLQDRPTSAARILQRQADEFDARAEELRRIAADVHVKGVVQELRKLTNQGDDFDLLHAALLLAKIDERDLQVGAYLEQVDKMAAEIETALAKSDEVSKLQAMNDFLFRQNGYHGSRFEYYHRANSYLNRVIDDREGIPISLSVLYMELGRRLGLNIVGIGLPGHFVVKKVNRQGEEQFIDVFDNATPLSRADVEQIVAHHAGRPLRETDLKETTKKDILRRMLHNLGSLAKGDHDSERLLHYVEAMMAVFPEDGALRYDRGVLRALTGRNAAAAVDFDWVFEHQPPGIDLEMVRVMRERLSRDP